MNRNVIIGGFILIAILIVAITLIAVALLSRPAEPSLEARLAEACVFVNQLAKETQLPNMQVDRAACDSWAADTAASNPAVSQSCLD